MLTRRVKERLKRQAGTADDLLRARREAVVAGLVPLQTAKIKRSQEEIILMRRTAMRHTTG